MGGGASSGAQVKWRWILASTHVCRNAAMVGSVPESLASVNDAVEGKRE